MTKRKRKASRKATKKRVVLTGKTPPLSWLRYSGRGMHDYSNDRLVPMNGPAANRRRARDTAIASDFKINRDMRLSFDNRGRAIAAETVLRSIIQVNADLVTHARCQAVLARSRKRISMLSVHGKKAVGNFVGRGIANNIADITWHNSVNGLRVTPIDAGCPDMVPIRFAKAFDAGKTPDSKKFWARFEHGGLEIKVTCGSLKPKTSKIRQAAFPDGELTYDATRIEFLSSVTWSAHHSDSSRLLTFLWDNIRGVPQIVAGFHSDNLNPDDYGKQSDPTASDGHSTNATSLRRRGKNKLRFVAVLNDRRYIEKLRHFLPESGL